MARTRKAKGPDLRVDNHGSIVLLQPLTPAAEAWLEEHIGDEAQMWGSAIVCEPRYVGDIVRGAQDNGLVVA